MHQFLSYNSCGSQSCYTRCYLTVARPQQNSTMDDGAAIAKRSERSEVHASFSQMLEPSMLSISEKQRSQFSRAMNRLMIKPHYHLSELEPYVIHPFKDNLLADICSCCGTDHEGGRQSYKHKLSCLEQLVEKRSNGKFPGLASYRLSADRTLVELARESWPKLCLLAPSDMVNPNGVS
jgi:hypothetical protein